MSTFFSSMMSMRFCTEPLPRIGSTRRFSPSSSTLAMSEPITDIGPPTGAVITVTVPALRRSVRGRSPIDTGTAGPDMTCVCCAAAVPAITTSTVQIATRTTLSTRRLHLRRVRMRAKGGYNLVLSGRATHRYRRRANKSCLFFAGMAGRAPQRDTFASQIFLKILRGHAELRHRLLQIVTQHRRSDQIGGGAIVVGTHGFAAQVAPVRDIPVAAAEP